MEFQTSPLNQKYLDLFTEIATKCAPKASAGGTAIGATGASAGGDTGEESGIGVKMKSCAADEKALGLELE